MEFRGIAVCWIRNFENAQSEDYYYTSLHPLPSTIKFKFFASWEENCTWLCKILDKFVFRLRPFATIFQPILSPYSKTHKMPKCQPEEKVKTVVLNWLKWGAHLSRFFIFMTWKIHFEVNVKLFYYLSMAKVLFWYGASLFQSAAHPRDFSILFGLVHEWLCVNLTIFSQFHYGVFDLSCSLIWPIWNPYLKAHPIHIHFY